MKRMNKHSLVKSRLGMGTVEVISKDQIELIYSFQPFIVLCIYMHNLE